VKGEKWLFDGGNGEGKREAIKGEARKIEEGRLWIT